MKFLIGAVAMMVCFYLGQSMLRSGMQLKSNGHKISGWFRIICSIQFILGPLIGMAMIFSAK